MLRVVRSICVLLLISSCAGAAPAGVQTGPALPRFRSGELLRQVVGPPTGRNGYEELVAAVEALSQSRHSAVVLADASTLAQKRQVLADPNAARALRLLKQGLAKPVSMARPVSFQDELPELVHFRALGKLLALEQYVLLADGRTGDAIENLRLAFRFSRAVQTETLISGLIGVAVSSLTIRPLAAHLDQLSARDCAVLYDVCVGILSEPDGLPRLVETERRLTIAGLDRMLVQAKQEGVGAAVKSLGLGGDTAAEIGKLPLPPALLDQVHGQAVQRLNEHYAEVQEELRKPAWQRRPVDYRGKGDFADHLVNLVLPSFDSAGQRYTREAAHLRLLVCHCAVLRYRWEHNAAPPGLDVLNLGELAVDPFTGQPFRYSASGRKYSLVSAGSPATNPDDPMAVDGRIPVTVIPD